MAAGRGDAPKRLLVLGAGPAQLGLLAAARERGLFVDRRRPGPGAVGLRATPTGARSSRPRTRWGSSGWPRPSGSTALIAPGIDWPVAIAARVAERRGIRIRSRAATAVLATSKLKQRERFREAGVPQPAFELCRIARGGRGGRGAARLPVRRQGARPAGPARARARARRADELEPAAREALDVARTATASWSSYAPGRELTVNAFLVGGRFLPLTITDR